MRKLVKATWDECQNQKSELIKKIGNFEITKTLIPYDYENATICYFIDYVEGDESREFGSVYSLEEAEQRIKELSK